MEYKDWRKELQFIRIIELRSQMELREGNEDEPVGALIVYKTDAGGTISYLNANNKFKCNYIIL